MPLRPEEIRDILRREIENYQAEADVYEAGTVVRVGDGIAYVYGLTNAMSNELLEFKGGLMGMALNLEEDSVGCVLLGPYFGIREGDKVRRTGRIVEVPVGEDLLGRVVDPLGRPLDGGAMSAIAAMELSRLRERAELAGVAVEAGEEVCAHLAGLCAPGKGARQLRRLIRENVEDPLTELMLSQPDLRRASVVLRRGGVVVESPQEQKTGRGVLP